MILPLFALGLLTAGTGIAKGLYDETQEQKRLREAMAALQGATRETMGATLNPAVANELAGARNPLMGRPTPELSANPRSAPDAQTAARLRLANAYAQINPEKALEIAQSMAPKPKSPIAVPKGTVLIDENGNEVYANREIERPANPSMLPIYNRNGDQVATINQNDPAALARYEPLLANGTYTTVKPENTDDKQPFRIMTREEKEASGLPIEGVYKTNGKDFQQLTPPRYETSPGTQKLKTIVAEGASLTRALDRFNDVVKQTDMSGSISAMTGGKTEAGRKLNAAWTNAALMAKGEGLFNLGVLNGPDLDIIQKTLPDPSTMSGLTTSKEAYAAAINEVKSLIKTRIEEFQAQFGKGAEQATAQAPEGVDQELWAIMTPDERALWQ